jgi:putative tricarboxylic transport membrane protein
MAEVQFRRAIQITQGDLSIFVTRPISLTLLAIAVAVLVVPFVKAAAGRRRS